MNMRLKISYFFILLLVAVGFIFRLEGIGENHSFWSDEAYVSYLARDVLTGKQSLVHAFNLTKYQPLHLFFVMISFALFGGSEFAARLPSVIFGTLGIVAIFFAARKLVNTEAGIVATFTYTFSQLNLANSTQAKPYTAIQSLFLLQIYLLTLLENKKNRTFIYSALIVANIASTLLHFIGVLNWIPLIIYLLLHYRRTLLGFLKNPDIIAATTIIMIAAFFIFRFQQMIYWFIFAGKGNVFFTFNHITFLRELLWRNYAFIVLPAVIGSLVAIEKKHKTIHLGVMFYVLVTVYLWTFKNYTHNIRYLVPLFGVLFLYFGIFWGYIIELFFNTKKFFLVLMLLALLFVGGYKFVRKPTSYYSPNADLLADIQIADYKTTFTQLKSLHPDYKNFFIINDWMDTQDWYLDKKPDALFIRHEALGIRYAESTINIATGIPTYTSLAHLKKIMQQQKKGFLIVEDWHSLLPDEIKEYAKKNLKREVRVEGLSQAAGDNWPLEIYSWGM